MIQIRNMTIEDCEAVAAIDKCCFSQCWSASMFEDTLQFSTYHYVVAVLEENQTLIGFAGILTSVDTADVVNIGVLPNYRCRGTGTVLLQNLEELAKDAGCDNMMLEVRTSNQAAIHIYNKAGFSEIAVRKNYYSNPSEDGIVMQKQISPFISTIH